jgi:serine/threonine-protein kinase
MEFNKFDTQRWRKLDIILDQVLDLPQSERTPKIHELCGDDASLIEDVIAFLNDTAKADGFLDKPAGENAAHLIEQSSRNWDPASRLGSRIGPYRLVGILGEGGMGIVYVGERDDGQYQKSVAIKLMLALGSDSPLRPRFLAERQMLAKLDHPNTARLLDGGITEDGYPFIVMELVDGESVLEYCDKRELGLDDRLALFEEVCAAVEDAHRHLILHCDLKPANILVTGEGMVKLLDFGIGRWLDAEEDGPQADRKPGRAMMTLAYASPEQLRGEPMTTASDVFSLGVLLHELLTGKRPWDIEDLDPAQSATKLTGTPAGPPSDLVADPGERGRLVGDLDAIILQAVAPDARNRYGSAHELAEDLRRHRRHLPVEAVASTPWYRFRKLIARNRAASVGVALVMMSIIAGIAGTAWQARVASMERDAARLEAQRAGAVSDFLTGLFEISDPDENAGEDVTAREVLDKGYDELAKLDDQPELQVALKGTMANVYSKLGLWLKSKEVYDEVLAASIELYGNESYQATDTRINLGIVCLESSLFDEAEAHLQECYDIRLNQEPQNDNWLVMPLLSLARVAEFKGNEQHAIELFEQAFAMMSPENQADAEGMGRAYNNYASALSGVGRYAGADSAFAMAEKNWLISLPENHTYFGALYSNWALTKSYLDQDGQAEVLHHKALAIKRKLKHNKVQIGVSLINLGNLLVSTGRPEEGLPMLTEALEINRDAFGNAHYYTAAAVINVGTAQLALGNYDAAESHYREGEEIFREIFGDEHAAVAIAHTRLGQAAHQRGDLERAERIFREAVAIHRPLLPSSRMRFGETLYELGEVLIKQGKPGAAEAHLDEALVIFNETLGVESEWTRKTRVLMADLPSPSTGG